MAKRNPFTLWSVLSLWDQGMDTCAIAQVLEVSEAEVYNLLARFDASTCGARQ